MSDEVRAADEKKREAAGELTRLRDPEPTAPREEQDAVRSRRAQLQAVIADTESTIKRVQPLLVPIAVSYGLRSCVLAVTEAQCASGSLKRWWVMAVFGALLMCAILLAIYWALFQVQNSWILPIADERLWYLPVYAATMLSIVGPPFALIAGYYRQAAQYVVPPNGWFLNDHWRLAALVFLLGITSALVAAVSVRISMSVGTAMVGGAGVVSLLALLASRGWIGWLISIVILGAVVGALVGAGFALEDFALAAGILALPLVLVAPLALLEFAVRRGIGWEGWLTTLLRVAAYGVCVGQVRQSRRSEVQIRKAVALGTVRREL